MGDSLAVNRRSFVRGALTAGGLAAIGSFAPSLRAASSARTVRLRWPWPVHLPDPHAAGDLVAALLGATIFPPLYVRAIDGLLEPRLAIGAPHETRRGLRVDLPYWIRQSDVVASISAAKSGGARLALKDVPVPRLDGYHGVLFPGLGDIDGLVRRLATPLAGIARIERRRLASTGAFDVSLQERESTRALILVRRPLAAMPGIPTTLGGAAGRGVQRFELEGAIELGATLRAFERGETDLAWLADGLFAPRPGARRIDLGPLAWLAVRAGSEVAALARPGTVLSIVDAIPPDRLGHLGLLRRGHCAPPPAPPLIAPARVPDRAPILVRASASLAVAAVEILAREVGGIPKPVDAATFDRALAERRFALAVDVVRAIDEGADGAAVSLATFEGAASAPSAGAGPRAAAASSTAALGWEIALIGAEAPALWIPRAAFGGLDLEGATEG